METLQAAKRIIISRRVLTRRRASLKTPPLAINPAAPKKQVLLFKSGTTWRAEWIPQVAAVALIRRINISGSLVVASKFKRLSRLRKNLIRNTQ